MYGLTQCYLRALDGLGRKPSDADRKFIRYCVMDVFATGVFYRRLRGIKLP
jgi:hypothetical protein